MKICQPRRSEWWARPISGNRVGTLAGWVIKRLGFNAQLLSCVADLCGGLRRTGYYPRFLDLVQLALSRWRWLRDDLGRGRKRPRCSGTSRSRGRLLAAYMMVYYGNQSAGQLMVSKLPTDLMSVLPWVICAGAGGDSPAVYPRSESK